MLSILIPIYNWNIENLAEKICQQCLAQNINFEIMALDDYSSDIFTKGKNAEIRLTNFRLIELSENVGNAEARNILARTAQYDWLLFLDADMLPVQDNFIKQYLNLIEIENFDVASGGIVYRENVSKEYCLKWLHGKRTEEHQAEKDPFLEIRGNNFLIRKQLFLENPFGGLPEKYGYVDTHFGLKLKKVGAGVRIIDNPCWHLGLETNERFVEKYKTSLRNAYWMVNNQPEMAENLRIIKTYKKIAQLGLAPFFSKNYQLFEKQMLRNLYSEKPSLFVFQLFKLCYFCSLSKA